MKGIFENTVVLTKLILRRERINSTAWILIIGLMMALVVVLFGGAMDDASRMEMAVMMENPAMIAMVGPAYGVDNFTIGTMVSVMMLVFMGIAVAVMNILFVVRHTRADEERGRYEVVRSLPTGRLANLHSTMVAAVIINIILAVFSALCLYISGDESMSLNGSMLWGALLGVVGLIFAAFAALFSQLSSNSRGAKGLSFLLMGIFYMMRAVGDVSAEPLSLINPLGLIIRSYPYVENNWLPVFILLAACIPVAAFAYRLNIIRDIDQGLLPDRQGKAEGGALLRTPFGLTVKLLIFSMIVGFVSIFAVGASYGTIMGDIDGFIAANEFYQQLLLAVNFPLPLLFAGMINFIGSILALIPMLLYVLKARSEEKEMRAELILATPVRRNKYLGGYAIIAFASTVILQATTAVSLWSTTSSVIDNPADFPLGDVLAGNLVYLPALWVMIGAAIFLIGIAPKLTGLIWGLYGLSFFMSFIGRLPNVLPGWTKYLTPFGVIPQLPMEDINYPALAVLTAIAACLTISGFIFYNKRDITA